MQSALSCIHSIAKRNNYSEREIVSPAVCSLTCTTGRVQQNVNRLNFIWSPLTLFSFRLCVCFIHNDWNGRKTNAGSLVT